MYSFNIIYYIYIIYVYIILYILDLNLFIFVENRYATLDFL